MRKGVGGKGSAILSDQNDVCSIIAKFPAQLGLHVNIEIQHRRSYSGGNHYRKQRRGRPASPQYRRSQKHSQEHRSVGHTRSAGREILRLMRHGGAHSSPLNANTGSRLTARRIAAALPANVTITAITRMTGSSTGGIEISELKIDRPISCARTPPSANPIAPPIRANNAASAKNIAATASFPAPRAFMSPPSARRSKIVVAIAAETANAEANSAANVIRNISPSMRVSTAPSFCATCRICSACECDIASVNCSAIAWGYGVQYQRS